MKSFNEFLNESKLEKVKTRYAELKKKPIAELKKLIGTYHRVYNTSGVPKGDIISDILVAEFGTKATQAAFED